MIKTKFHSTEPEFCSSFGILWYNTPLTFFVGENKCIKASLLTTQDVCLFKFS